jgi:hypothetical protein
MPDDLTFRTLLREIGAAIRLLTWTPIAHDAADDGEEPYATHEGLLDIPGLGVLRVFQLNTGQRVFASEDLDALLGIEGDAPHA